MRNDRRNYVVVGVFVIAMVVALIGWIAMVSGFGGATESYYVLYDNVMGLQDGTQIYYEGFPVGLIEDIERGSDDEERGFRVDVSIRKDWKIPADSVAHIKAPGLLSGVVIDISAGASSTPIAPHSRIPSVEPVNIFDDVSSIAGVATELIDQEIKPLVADIRRLLGRENTSKIESILSDLQSTSSNLANASTGLASTLKQMERFLGEANALLEAHGEELGHTVVDLHFSLETIARHIEAISHNLEGTTRNMNEFSRQIRDNPGLIIRGRDSGDSTP